MTVPVLTASSVEVRYPGASQPALADADLEVREGASLGIVGESGSGKTTLARALVGALRPTAGRVAVQGRAWDEIGRKDPLRRSVQMVFQDPYASLNPSLTPRQAVAEVFRVWERQSREVAARSAAALLAEMGMEGDVIDRRPALLSGGQRQRVGIARALACSPAVLVADEPTASLDVSVQAQILNLLADLRDSRGLALVLVSHDLAVVRHVAAETYVLYAGKVVERGPTHTLFESPRHPYTRVLLDSIPERGGDLRLVRNEIEHEPGCPFAPRCGRMTAQCIDEEPALRGRSPAVACHHPYAEDPRA